MNRESVDSYLEDGCGRCDDYKTPNCKVHLWTKTLVTLRALLREESWRLHEAMKWGSPTYAITAGPTSTGGEGRNVLQIVSFRDHCALSFFQGAALADPEGLLESPGPNSRYVRFARFRTVADITAREAPLRALVAAAVAFAEAGGKVDPAPVADLPAELVALLDGDPALATAFEALTPGRRRSHGIHVGGAKQEATRQRRAEACIPDILAGRGFRER